MPANTSATGGYLVPSPLTPPIEGDVLYDFVHDLIAGVTGLDGTLVRPRYQAEPPNIPDADVAWCAFGIMTRDADTFPAVKRDPSGDGSDVLQRQEELSVLASFYDLGSSGQADFYATLLRDGLAIAQNREVMQGAGWGLGYTGDLTPVPSLLKERWLYRVDLSMRLRRQIDRTYPVLNLESAGGTIITESGLEEDFLVENP